MKIRPVFQCWNCPMTYTLQVEITEKMAVFVACPYCQAEGVVDLTPYQKEKFLVTKSGDHAEQSAGIELILPEILPVQKPQ